MLKVEDGVAVFTPEHEAEARALPLPRVALFQAESFGRPKPPPLFGADAYASHERALPEAIAWVTAEDRSARQRGPWRVVYVGSLGEDPVTRQTPLGKTVMLSDEPIVVGRMEDCAICLRQGPHSDQNTVGKRNTKIELVGGQPVITDLRSTNGTRIVGCEFAVGLGQHLRLDGAERG